MTTIEQAPAPASATASQSQTGGVACVALAAAGAPYAVGALADFGGALDAALADPALRAIVLRLAPPGAPRWCDLAPAGDPRAGEAELHALADRVAAAAKPVVALIENEAAGPIAALALAAGVRVAATEARFGFPEARLGLVPGGGAIGRAAGLAGAEAALRVMLGGQILSAPAAQAAGLVEIVTSAAPEAAIAAARALAAEGGGGAGAPFLRNRRAGMAEPARFLGAVAAARAALRRDRSAGALPAGPCLADCVEAALLLPAEAARAQARDAFETLATTPEARALIHLARSAAAARGAAPPPALAEPPIPGGVAILGGSGAGVALAAALAGSGVPVTLLEAGIAPLRRMLEQVAALLDRAVEEGRLEPAARDAGWDRIAATTDTAALADCWMGIEAVAEAPGLREAALRDLARALPPDAVLATTAPRRALGPLAAVAARTEDWTEDRTAERPSSNLIGLHVLTPLDRVDVIEIGTLPQTAAAARAAGMRLACALGKAPVVVRPEQTVAAVGAPAGGRPAGYAGGRLLLALRQSAADLVLSGADPAALDRALCGFGFGLGPFEMMDRVGLDRIVAQLARAEAERTRPDWARPGIAAPLAAAGATGARAGRGIFDWAGGRCGALTPEAAALIAAERSADRPPVAEQAQDAGALVAGCLAAIANEGARLLSAGVVAGAGDLDLLAVAMLGFPRHRGGPMHWAGASGGRAGLIPARAALRRIAAALPADRAAFWQPDPLWETQIRAGRPFEAP